MDNELNPEAPNNESESNEESGSLDPKIEAQRQKLLNRIVGGTLKETKDKVGFILNNYPESRNSDKKLSWYYWTIFESEKINGNSISEETFVQLTNVTSITRQRAKIQNEYKLFQADEKVRRYRGMLAEDEKEKAIDDKPVDLPIYQVYIDETGKTQDYLSIGSLWVTNGYSTFTTMQEIKKWKDEQNINYEFHFNKLNQHKLEQYKKFIELFLALNPTVAFKAIIINKRGLSDLNSSITDLSFHLINKGIEHENNSGRAPLPRRLEVFLDEEEPGSDKLKLENLKERLYGQRTEGLYLGNFEVINSETSVYIQAVDLFIASINRKLHNPDSTEHPKDILASYILDILGFDLSEFQKENSIIDRAQVFNLAYESGE